MRFVKCLFLLCSSLLLNAQNIELQNEFDQISKLPWQLRFEDDCTKNYKKKWHKDGERSILTHSPAGMDFYAGKEAFNDTCHTVLWTKKRFSGDVKVEYDYTRLDTSSIGVNIIYLLASGSGKKPYKKNLFRWNKLRRVPAMRVYFNHVNTYHISYAVFGKNNPEPDYVRARRYLPETGKGLEGTALFPEYSDTGLFEIGVKHQIVVIRRGDKLYMKVTNPSQSRLFWFDTSDFPPIESGRIGLRQMWTRAARYANFRISEL